MVVLPFNRRTVLNRDAFDRQYVERLLSGDPQTEQHFCVYFGALIRLKVRARGLGAQFEDIRQETLMRVLRALRSPDGLRDPGALGAFVNSFCDYVIRETGRSLKRDRVAPAAEPDAVPDLSTQGNDARLMTEELKVAVRRVIDNLPERDRELLRAMFLEELDRDCICVRMGVTRDYLRVLLHRAKNEFRTRYQAECQKMTTSGPAAAPIGRTRR